MPTLIRIGRVPVDDPVPAAGAGDDLGAQPIGVVEYASGVAWTVVERRISETLYVLTGSAVLTDSDRGQTHPVGPGDLVVLPTGWSGRIEATTGLRVIYVRTGS